MDMKGFVMRKDGLSLERLPKPSPSSGEVLVRIQWASVCGSDYPFFSGQKSRDHLIGEVFGHEGAGEIVELGEGVSNLKVGDKVGLESHRARKEWIAQGKDPYGDPLCAIIGHRSFPDGTIPQGTFAEYIAVPAVYANKVPAELFEKYPASLWEPLGNSIRLASIINRQAKPAQVVVSGCGPQGIMILLILKHWLKFEKLAAVDVNESRLELAKQLGIRDVFTPDQLPNLKPELWLEMSGAIPAFRQAMSMVNGGNLILFGLPKEDPMLVDNWSYSEFIFQNREADLDGVHLIGVCGRLKEDWEAASEIVKTLLENVELGKLYSNFGSLENLHQLKDEVLPPRSGSIMKVLFSGFIT